ncbi:TPA: hypothetical protein ACSEHU_001718 [Streptococcus pyogenes]
MDASLLSPILTAIIGYITIRSNRKSNRRNNLVSQKLKEKELNANVISNARIKWLEQVREHTASHIENVFLYYSRLVLHDNSEGFIIALSDYRKSYYMIKLFFSERDVRGRLNKDHEKIINALKDIDIELEKLFINAMIKKEKVESKTLNKTIGNFCNICSIYYKKVWEEAKDIENAR